MLFYIMQFRKRSAIALRNLHSGFLIALISLNVSQVDAQGTAADGIISLKKEKIALPNAKSYYLLDLLDMRSGKSQILGTINVHGKSVSLQTGRPLNREVYDHWKLSTRGPTEGALPLEILIDEFGVSERKITPNKIAGEMRIKFTFQWTRGDKKLFLINYITSTNYTRPEQAFDHESVIRRLVDGGIRHFDQWIGQNDGKNPLLARNVTLVFTESDYPNQKDTVYYDQGKKLTWYDFQGNTTRPSTKYAAAVFSSMAYEGNSRMSASGIQVVISLKVFMVRNMSWGKAEARNAYTLAHEQTHFDITRIMAERFKERLKKMDLSIEDYDSQIQYEFLDAFREMNDEQKKYDGETRHGLDTSAQATWTERVNAEITRIYQGS